MPPIMRISAMMAVCLALGACANNPFARGGGGSDAALAPAPAPAGPVPGSADDPTSAAYFQARVGDRVLFPVNQDNLTPQAQATLAGQAQWLNTNSGFSAIIEGHADEQGTREYNLALGARRASAVQEYLISQGVAGTRLRTVTYGKERPIEICSEEACYANNRRGVTVLQAAGGTGF